MKLDGLEILHENMKNTGFVRTKFDFRKNGKLFKVIFLTDINPYKLLIGVRSEKFCLPVDVSNSYEIKTSMNNDDYRALIDILGLKYDENNHFKPRYFFEELNSQVPKKVNVNSIVQIHEIAELNPGYEESEKIYFKGWLDNNIRGNNVSPKNLYKTRDCLGEEAYQMCKKYNISSVWTKYRTESKKFYLPEV
ncbi:DUF6037 family protein [Bacillus vallismortis]|uniref:DUF6037 family protein n=1 Tax=Bacillus vallismortis TaxID=72361 RepID=UPI002280F232|nr:DUF6037 family protein [Bacillus vallismortis]MCY7919952.1 DUF6037 family protein [Bacillus vallismortis]